jgi:AP-3 complex subunit delta-1
MASRKSLAELAKRLMDHAIQAEGGYRNFLVRSIVNMCNFENYSRITDFEWYVDLLVQLASMQSVPNATLIAQQIMVSMVVVVWLDEMMKKFTDA